MPLYYIKAFLFITAEAASSNKTMGRLRSINVIVQERVVSANLRVTVIV